MYLVCRLLLEKKKTPTTIENTLNEAIAAQQIDDPTASQAAHRHAERSVGDVSLTDMRVEFCAELAPCGVIGVAPAVVVPVVVFFQWYGAHRDLHSFPTRRSSDLKYEMAAKLGAAAAIIVHETKPAA